MTPREDDAADDDLDLIAERHDEEALLTELAKLKPFDYARRREEATDELGVTLKDLDAEVKRRRKALTDDGGGKAVKLYEPEPWPDPVDGATLADDIAAIIHRTVILATVSADTAALWTIFTHVHDAARFSPVLGIVSPSPECGKTTLLSTVALMVPKPLWANNITGAAVFRSIERWQPTLVVDEADSFLSDNEELRGILNSGHNKDAAFVIRTTGDEHEPRQFRTWCPKVIALIGKLPPTLISRALLIELRRFGVTEHVEPLDDHRAHVLTLGRQCARWALDHVDEIRKAKPSMPPSLRGRRADNWKTMLAIAEEIGGDWSERGRRAALAISGGRREESAGIELLDDIKVIFNARRQADKRASKERTDKLTSKEIVEALVAMEERPWPEWSNGKPLTTRQLATLLEPFKVKPRTIRTVTGTPKGYHLVDFADAFARYSPDTPPSRSATPPQAQKSAVSEPIPSATSDTDVADENGRNPAENSQCGGVAAGNPPHAQNAPSATNEGVSEFAAKAKALESILKRFRRLALDVRDSPDEGDTDWDGGWPDDVTRLGDAIGDFAAEYRDPDSIHAIVTAVLNTPKLGIGGERGTAAHRYLWDRAVHLAAPEDRKRLIQARPSFDNE